MSVPTVVYSFSVQISAKPLLVIFTGKAFCLVCPMTSYDWSITGHSQYISPELILHPAMIGQILCLSWSVRGIERQYVVGTNWLHPIGIKCLVRFILLFPLIRQFQMWIINSVLYLGKVLAQLLGFFCVSQNKVLICYWCWNSGIILY